jgi:hypothetical protein
VVVTAVTSLHDQLDLLLKPMFEGIALNESNSFARLKLITNEEEL